MGARVKRLLLALVSIVLGLLALWVLEASRLSAPAQMTDLAPRDAKVVVFLIDSLAAQEATDAAFMPKLGRRIAQHASLHGPVRACADAVTVPCITAMLTGVDRFSVFALGRNFGGGALEGSLLQHLAQRGRRIGYVGERMLQNTFAGLDYLDLHTGIDDELNLRRSLEVLAQQDLDLMIVHLRELDELSHKIGTTTPEYQARARKIDAALDATLDALPRDVQPVVLGDHGHTLDGRHFAGLEVPSYAAYFGPMIPRSLERPMAITDHGAILARLFGLRFGQASWVDDYFDGKPVAVPTELPSLPSNDHTPWWGFAGCLALGLGVLVCSPALRGLGRARRQSMRALLLGLALAIVLGLSWLEVRPMVAFVPLLVSLCIVVATGVLGALIMAPIVRMTWPDTRLDGWVLPLLGALVFGLPTIYKYGGPFAVLTWLGIAIAWLAIDAFRAGERRRALGIAALWVPFYTLYNPAVRNFSVRWFPVYSEWLRDAAALACVAWLAIALLVAWRERITIGDLIGLVVGVALAAARDVAPAWLYVAPCALALPACALALRRPELGQLAVAMSIPAVWFSFEGDAVVLAPVAALLVLWAALPKLVPAHKPLARAAMVLTLVLASFWTSMGCRMTGVSFDFFFAWLPEGSAVTDTWALTALFAVTKYFTLPMLGMVLAARAAGPQLFESLRALDVIVPARAAYAIAFLAAFSVASPTAGPFITADIVQEATLWLLILAVVTFLPDRAAAAALDPAGEVELAPGKASTQTA